MQRQQQQDEFSFQAQYEQRGGLMFLFSAMTIPFRRVFMGERYWGLAEQIGGFITGFIILSYGRPDLAGPYVLAYFLACQVNRFSRWWASRFRRRVNSLSWGRVWWLRWLVGNDWALALEPWIIGAAGVVLIYGFEENFGVFLLWSAVGERLVQWNADQARERILRDMQDYREFQENLMNEYQSRQPRF